SKALALAVRMYSTISDCWTLTKPEVNFLIVLATFTGFYLGHVRWRSIVYPGTAPLPIRRAVCRCSVSRNLRQRWLIRIFWEPCLSPARAIWMTRFRLSKRRMTSFEWIGGLLGIRNENALSGATTLGCAH